MCHREQLRPPQAYTGSYLHLPFLFRACHNTPPSETLDESNLKPSLETTRTYIPALPHKHDFVWPSVSTASMCKALGSAPPPFSRAQGAPPSLLHVLFSVAYLLFRFFWFFFFLQGRVQSVQGAMLIYPRDGCGSTTCCLFTCWSASPKQVRSWCLVVWEPSWFLCITWHGEAMCGLQVQRCRSFATSWWFFLPGVSPASSAKFLLSGTHTICFFRLVAILEKPTGCL
jgi:hypothetical protein